MSKMNLYLSIQSQRNPVSFEKILQNVPAKKITRSSSIKKRGEAREKISFHLLDYWEMVAYERKG